VEGDAISLVCVDEAPMLRDIERLLGSAIPSELVPGFEPDRSIRAEPIRFRTGGGGGGGRPTRRPAGRPAAPGQNRPRRFDRRAGRPNASVGIGNGGGRWTNLPGERTRR
jgi:ATP-dependent RNA helicase RhlE